MEWISALINAIRRPRIKSVAPPSAFTPQPPKIGTEITTRLSKYGWMDLTYDDGNGNCTYGSEYTKDWRYHPKTHSFEFTFLTGGDEFSITARVAGEAENEGLVSVIESVTPGRVA